jgi:subtilisin family serine protease
LKLGKLLYALGFWLGFGLGTGCGEKQIQSLSKVDLDRYSHAIPTYQNYSAWKSEWVEDSWIVGLKKTNSPELMQPSQLNSLVLKGILRKFGFTQAVPADLKSLLSSHVITEILYQPQLHRRVSAPMDESLDNIAEITIKNSGYLFDQLMNAAPKPPFEFSNPLAAHKNVLWQWKTIYSIDNVEFVEPNLYTQVQQATSPDTKGLPSELSTNADSRIVEVMNQIKFNKAYQQIVATKTSLGQVVVGVIDTGVDHAHPELAQTMFANPGEGGAPDGADNDGNGYVDDIHGIDASIRKGEVDKLAAPIPGSADVGGPGANCPERHDGKKGGGCGHGTHVAGIIAAKHNSNGTPLGVCPNCKIVALRVATRCLEPATANNKDTCVPADRPAGAQEYVDNSKLVDTYQLRALNYILNLTDGNGSPYINIVNMSFGKYFFNRGMALAISSLKKRGISFVAAAGNDNTSSPMFPAGYSSSFTVCATSASAEAQGRGLGAKTSFSNFGDHVDICAPGFNIHSAIPGGATDNKPGTSQAAPLVAGAIGLIRGAFGTSVTLEEIEDRLKRYADYNTLYGNPLNALFGGEQYGKNFYLLGSGILDLDAAFNKNRDASLAYSDDEFGGTSQDASGCLVSTIGKTQAKPSPFFNAPILLAALVILKQLLTKRLGMLRRQPEPRMFRKPKE